MTRSRNPRRNQPQIEGLETRALLALLGTDYSLASPFSRPQQIVSGPGGNLWFDESEAIYQNGAVPFYYAIGAINPKTHAIVEFPTNTQDPSPYFSDNGGIAVGSDGNLWFTEPNANKVGVFNPTTGKFAEFTLPTANAQPEGIASGSDGNLYFTESGASQIGEINPTTHAITEFPLAQLNLDPYGITAGPDGNLWFTGAQIVGEINPTTHAISEFSSLGTSSSAITVGPDGNLWFSSFTVSEPGLQIFFRLAEINPTTHVTTSFPSKSGANAITTGPDGNLYYVNSLVFNSGSGSVTEFGVATKAVTTYETPPAAPPFIPVTTGITLGPDGNLWYTDSGSGRVGVASIIPATEAAISGSVRLSSGSAVAGQTVEAYLETNGQLTPGAIFSAVTDSSGNYTISGLTPGTYIVQVGTYPGELVTTPSGGSLSVTLTGGEVATGQSFTIFSASSVLPLTLNGVPFGTHNPDISTAEVTGLYNMILGRAPDPAGLAGWVSALKSGTLKLPQVAADFLDSTEYLSHVVGSYYQNFLDRAASSAEIAAWVSAMQGGKSEEQVATAFFESAEFNRSHGDNSTFVQGLYNDILGRHATDAEVSAWSGALSSGTSQSQVISDVLGSTEADMRAVVGFYEIILAGEYDPSGINFWVAGLQSGATLSTVASDFFSSTTFVALANASVG
jgi:streptogramin lyase